MKRFFPFLGMVFALSTVAFAQEGAEPLSLTAPPGETRIEVDGATPGATVVILGVSHRSSGFLPTTIRTERLAVADATGHAESDVPEPIPSTSVWFAVDLESGALAILAPPDRTLEMEKPGRGIGNTLSFLEDQRQFLHVLVARPAGRSAGGGGGDPGAGAWGLLVGDGGDFDRDGAVDGRLQLAFLDLRPITDTTPAPERLEPGDVVIGVDSLTLQYYAERLAAPPSGSSTVDAGGAR